MDRFIDIHCHILYGIDDGSKNYEESIELLKQHAIMGATDVILTPHYIENTKYKTNNKEKLNLLETLKEEAEKLNLNLYLGNEVFVNNNLEEQILNGEIRTLNNTRYLLIELPMTNKIKNLKEIIYELKIKGITPIIAHPERYEYVQKNPKYISELIEEGALFQANYGSILGVYGNAPKRTIKKLLKYNYISFLGTDIHYPNSKIYKEFEKAIKKISKIIGEERLEELVQHNPRRVLDDEEILN